MLKFLIIIIIVSLVFKFYELKLYIDVRSFFKRGFRKTSERFGLYCYTGKQRYGENI